MAGRFIKLYDKILNWEWFGHPNTLSLFIYLLVKAYYKDTTIGGKVIRRGQLVTSLTRISTDCGMTIQQARTALSHLISTGEITDEASNQNRIITVVKYDDYQSSTGESTGNQQAINMRPNRQSTCESTRDSTTYIEYIEDNRKDRNIESLSTRERSARRFVAPSPDEVMAYCQENGIQIDADRFVDYYASKGWLVGKSPMKDWRAAARGWAKRDREQQAQAPAPAPVPAQRPAKTVIAQDYDQRDYSGSQEYWENRMRERLMERRRQNENI